MPDAGSPRIDLSVVVVSYNTRATTLECLRCLFEDLGGVDAEVIVVDNASTDGSGRAIAAAFPQVRLISNERNCGFGAANNMALAIARGRSVLLLNSDAFVGHGTVEALRLHLEEYTEAGVVGPRLLNEDGSLQRSCFRFPTPARAWIENLWLGRMFGPERRLGDYRGWAHDRVLEVDWVVGACMLVRREAIDRVGGFDERFFMYAEETDWQKRIRDAGWEVHFTPAAEVVHLGGASGASDRARINEHFFTSLDLYQRKHHGRLGLALLRAAMVVGCALRVPAWAAAYVMRPHQRGVAAAKLRLHRWLLLRQMLRWHGAGATGAGGANL